MKSRFMEKKQFRYFRNALPRGDDVCDPSMQDKGKEKPVFLAFLLEIEGAYFSNIGRFWAKSRRFFNTMFVVQICEN